MYPRQPRDYDSIMNSVANSNVVINLMGKHYETKNFSFEDVHVDIARMVAKVGYMCTLSLSGCRCIFCMYFVCPYVVFLCVCISVSLCVFLCTFLWFCVYLCVCDVCVVCARDCAFYSQGFVSSFFC